MGSAFINYKVMSFGLKNDGATHKRLMDKVFVEIMRNIMEVYVDDIVIKFVLETDHPTHLQTMFNKVHHHNMRLNPKKCFFGVAGRKFLGFIITQRGMEANPNKCEAILNMRSPTNQKICKF